MVTNVKQFKQQQAGTKHRRQKSKGIPWETIYNRWCQLADLSKPSYRTKLRGLKTKVGPIIDDVILIILNAVEQITEQDKINMDVALVPFSSPEGGSKVT